MIISEDSQLKNARTRLSMVASNVASMGPSASIQVAMPPIGVVTEWAPGCRAAIAHGFGGHQSSPGS